MTRDERIQYNKDYRSEGFGRIADHKYYMSHREVILSKQRMRDMAKRMDFRKNRGDVLVVGK